MKQKKIPLRFTHQQRNGIFLLLFLVIGLELLYYKVQNSKKRFSIDRTHQEAVQQEIDSLMVVYSHETKSEVRPFNPNFISDFKGYMLGMVPEEIDRLLKHRKKGLWVNTAEEFQKVTGISDSLLEEISPMFRFPEWVSNRSVKSVESPYFDTELSYADKKDLNKATVGELQLVNGVGKVLSERIIRLRNSFPGGFIHSVQLADVYGLSPEVIERIENRFVVKSPRQVEKISLNSATVEQLVTVQHIEYELAHEIVKQRTLREGFKSWEELTKVKDFPQNKIAIIQLYLSLD